ncbi:MAG: GerMN domain-containing protein [Selenomonadaceae bacterium]|nr:GerMN domain-containing protein [Selenomonadaceae bacterium]
MSNLRKILIFLMTVVMLICSGCENDPKGSGMTDKSNTEKAETLDGDLEQSGKDPKLPPKPPQLKSDKKDEMGQMKKMKVKVYYPDESGLRLIGVNREIEISDSDGKYKAAVEAVMTPPKEKNLTKVVSNNSSLISVDVKDGTALVNLSKNIKIGFVGGSTGEELLIGSVVNTLTEFKEVNAVKFLIDGQEVETLSGHMDLSAPIKRMENLMKH